MDELDKVVSRLDANINALSRHESIDFLSKLRKSRINRPDIVYKVGSALIDGNFIRGGEIWSMYEQVLIASLQMGDIQRAERYKDILAAKFGSGGASTSGDAEGSSRVSKLEGMIMEARGRDGCEAALKLYGGILEANPANLPVMKRKATLLRSMGQHKAATEALHDIIKMYGSDVQAWGEMAELYIEVGDLQAGAFCLEELVLLNPMCVAYHTRLAECLYSQGTTQSLLKARKHYSISLNTQSANLNKRALYGLMATCRRMLAEDVWPESSDGRQGKLVTTRLLDWAQLKSSEGMNNVPEIAKRVSDILSRN